MPTRLQVLAHAVLRRRFGLLLAAAFLVSYYFLYLGPQLNSVAVEMTLAADEPGAMMVFWPDGDDEYSAENSRPFDLVAESAVYRFTVPVFSKRLKFRFDPDDKANRVRLEAVTLSGLGRVVTFGPEGFERFISHAHDIKWENREGALVIDAGDDDARLFFSGKPFAGVEPLILLAPIAVLALFLVGVSGLARTAPDSPWRDRVLALSLSGVLFMSLGGGFSGQDGMFRAILFSVLVSTATMLMVSMLARARDVERGRGFANALVLSGFFLAVLVTQLFLTLNDDTVAEMKQTAGAAFAAHRDEGWNAAMKQAGKALEETFLRRFSVRDELVNLNAESKIFLLGFSPSQKAIIGKDNWFFEGYGDRRVEEDIVRPFDNITDYMGQNPFSDAELEQWRIALEERYFWLRERGIDYVFAMAPSKAQIYPEKLPDRILDMKRRLKRPTRYDQLVEYLRLHSVVPVVDLRAALLRAKARYPDIPLYYRTDFHWNYHGSLFAYRAIVEEINRAYPRYRLEAADVGDFSVRKKTDWVHLRFMASVGLDPLRHQDETYYTFVPKPESGYGRVANFLETGISDYTIPRLAPVEFGGKRLALRELENPGGELSLVFVIGDSFIEKTVGYFTRHARRVVNFRVVTQFPTEPYTVGGMQPNIVIQEVLNMYLLQPPPRNPSELRGARERALREGATAAR
ncbi:MAG: hypothetical protein DWQ08_15210 [Proteobacteria bacterium]|nr:MAG: hypothetical protein DWQ08_15210 [Pseudomonadota bacterium]